MREIFPVQGNSVHSILLNVILLESILKKKKKGEGGGQGLKMGNTCTPMVDSSQCMAKPIQCCKVK